MRELKDHQRLCLLAPRGVFGAEQPTCAASARCHQARSHLGRVEHRLAEGSRAVKPECEVWGLEPVVG